MTHEHPHHVNLQNQAVVIRQTAMSLLEKKYHGGLIITRHDQAVLTQNINP
jgi:hypothetical protein